MRKNLTPFPEHDYFVKYREGNVSDLQDTVHVPYQAEDYIEARFFDRNTKELVSWGRSFRVAYDEPFPKRGKAIAQQRAYAAAEREIQRVNFYGQSL